MCTGMADPEGIHTDFFHSGERSKRPLARLRLRA
jgi:hypothetical protein